MPVRRLYPIVLIGLMSNNIAPARIGELVRAYLVGEREAISKSTALGTIAVDRAFDGLTLVAILGVVTVATGADVGVRGLGSRRGADLLRRHRWLVALAMSPSLVRGWLSVFFRMLPSKIGEKAESVIDAFLDGLVAIRSPGVLAMAGGASLISWLLEASMYYVVGQAFHLDVGFDVYLIHAGANLALSSSHRPAASAPSR